MMAFILATDFDFIAYMSKMAFFFFFTPSVPQIILAYSHAQPRISSHGG